MTTNSKPKKRINQVLKWIVIIIVLLLVLAYFGIGYVAANTLTKPKRQFDPTHNPGG